jgi:hypothetical protein
MNQAQSEHLKRLNPTGIQWSDMTEQQQLELRQKWNAVVSDPKNLNCTCPNAPCRNNRNCMFCVSTHRYYGSLPDCLRPVDDKISEGVPPEKRHNIHITMNRRQVHATSRDEYYRVTAAWHKEHPEESAELNKKNVAEWHALVRDRKNTACRCSRTDCWYHGNCVKCLALHRYYDGFPACCQDIHDKIDAAAQAYRQEGAV